MAKNPLERLDKVAGQLAEALGDNLVSLLVYGSAARDNFDPARSDVNLLMILVDAQPAALRPAAQLVRSWVRDGQPPPLIVSEKGWRSSTDVFAMEMEDMRQSHRLLRGRDPFDGLETSPADLRDELEREARGKLLQLRAEFLAAETDGRALTDLLLRSSPTFFVLFRALLRLRGVTPPLGNDDLVERTVEVAGLDHQAFDWILGRIAKRHLPDLKPYDPIAERYLLAVERLVDFIDAMD